MKRRTEILVYVILISILVAQVVLAQDFLEGVLDPFKGLNINQLYGKYHGIIDLVVYIIVFTGVAEATIGKRFEGRGGKAMVAGVSISLAIAMALASHSWGISLASFGPVAVAIVVLLLAFILFQTMKHMNIGGVNSGAIAFLAVYFIARGIVPEFFEWIMQKAPFIGAIASIAVVVCTIKLMIAIWPHGSHQALAKVARHVKQPGQAIKEIWPSPEEKAEFSKEERVIKGKMERTTRKEKRESKHIIKDLEDMKKIVLEHGSTAKGRDSIAEKIRKIAKEEHYIKVLLQRLKYIDSKLERFDIAEFKSIKQRYDQLTDEQKEKARKDLLLERKKIKTEDQIRQYEQHCEQFDRYFTYCLNKAAQHFTAGNQDRTIQHIDQAIHFERKTKHIYQRMKKLEKHLLSLTKKELKV